MNVLPPVFLMSLVSGIFYLISTIAFYRFALSRGISNPFPLALAFALFPLAGLMYAVYPISDASAIALFMLSILALEKRQWWWATALAGASLVFHKVMWFFVPPVLLAAFITQKESRRILPLAVVPLVVWVITGSFHYGRLTWFVDWGVDSLLTPRSTFPIFDGLLTPILSGSLTKTVKGLWVGILLAFTLVCTYQCWIRRFYVGVGICLSLLALIALVNSYEIWVVARYGKLLLVPVVFLNPGSQGAWSSGRTRAFVAVVLIAMLLSNLAYAVFFVRYYHQ